MTSYLLAARAAPGLPDSTPGSSPTPGHGLWPPVPQHRRRIDLLGVNGDVIGLTGGRDGLWEMADPPAYGFWMGDYEEDLQPTPGVDGARYGDVRAKPRPVGLTVRFDVPTVAARRVLANRLVRALNPKRGLAAFLVTEADATARLVAGRVQGSAERWRVARQRGAWSIDLLAADTPYWLDAPGSELPAQTWSAPAPVDYYPYLPTNLVEDSAIGEPITIDNNGHEEVSPDWLIYGPSNGALFANDTTGEQLRWTGSLAAGKWLAFITQPGMQEVVDSDGVSRFHELAQDPEPAFWTLAGGVNIIRTVVDGIAPGVTSVMLLPQQRRWLVAG